MPLARIIEIAPSGSEITHARIHTMPIARICSPAENSVRTVPGISSNTTVRMHIKIVIPRTESRIVCFTRSGFFAPQL